MFLIHVFFSLISLTKNKSDNNKKDTYGPKPKIIINPLIIKINAAV